MFRTYDISNFIYTFFGIFVKLKELYKKHSYTALLSYDRNQRS